MSASPSSVVTVPGTDAAQARHLPVQRGDRRVAKGFDGRGGPAGPGGSRREGRPYGPAKGKALRSKRHAPGSGWTGTPVRAGKGTLVGETGL